MSLSQIDRKVAFTFALIIGMFILAAVLGGCLL